MPSIAGVEPAHVEMARNMPLDSIPEKLRCGTCDKLALGAVKPPCCDTPICGFCHETLSETACPVCTHSPFDASLCLPAKNLHSTIKAFVRTEAKKRATEQANAHKSETQQGDEVNEETPIIAETIEQSVPPQAAGDGDPGLITSMINPSNEGTSAPREDAEPISMTQDKREQADAIPHAEEGDQGEDGGQEDEEEDDDEDVVITTERPDSEQQPRQFDGTINVAQTAESEGFNQQNGHFNMQDQNNFGNMMNMTAMNAMNGMSGMNGMDPMQSGFMPSMMGMPGMGMGMGMGMVPGMDPSMMFGNFGGMGMNEMNMNMMGMGMGMGMGGMGGMNGMNGMGDMGNFGGMGGPGFFPPNQGDYMQSNFGNQRQQQFFNNHGQGRPYGRGFGRGRGQYGRGRGGFGYQNNFGHQQPHVPSGPQQSGSNAESVAPTKRGSPSYEAVPGAQGPSGSTGEHPMGASGDASEASSRDTNQAEETTKRADGNLSQDRGANAREHHDTSYEGNDDISGAYGQSHEAGDAALSQIQTVDHTPNPDQQFIGLNDMQSQEQQHGMNGPVRGSFPTRDRGRGAFHGGYQRGQENNTDLTPTPAPPTDAPKGPKAWRAGLPNTGWSGRALTAQKPASIPTPAKSAQPTQEDAKFVEQTHDQERTRQEHEAVDSNSAPNKKSHSRSRSRSRSAHQSSRYRDKSRSVEYESDAAYARRKEKERERRKRKDRERRHDEEEQSRARSRDTDHTRRKDHHRSRSQSRSDDTSRRQRREKEDDHRSSRTQRDRSKDKHKRRHRSRSPTRDDYEHRKSKSRRDDDNGHASSSRRSSRRDVEEYRDDDRKHRSSHKDSSRRERDRERERGRDGHTSRAIVEPPSDEQGFKIKGGSSNKPTSMAPPSRDRHADSRPGSAAGKPSSSSDPYAEERARAQQNRVVAEQQRRQSSSLGKRGRGEDLGVDVPTGPKSQQQQRNTKKVKKETRQINYKYEDEIGVGDGHERERGRWR